MQFLVKILKNSLYGEQIKKDIEESFACKSEAWMMSEYDESVESFWKLSLGTYNVKTIDDKGLEDFVGKLNTMPFLLGASVLSNSKRIMNDFIHAINGFSTNDVYYGETDIVCTENKHWDKLDKAGLVGKFFYKVKTIIKTGISSTDSFEHRK